jgi:hypothetical protein
MAITDIFNFDTAQYRSRIATLSDADLQRSEVTKLRQENGAVASGLGGVFLAPLTGGVSLIGSVYGARRYSIASQKLQIIQKELDARILPSHVLSDRDEIIPVLSACIGLGAGFDVGQVLDNGTGNVVDHFVVHHATQAAAQKTTDAGLSWTFDERAPDHGKSTNAAAAKMQASVTIKDSFDDERHFSIPHSRLRTWRLHFGTALKKYELLRVESNAIEFEVYNEFGRRLWRQYFCQRQSVFEEDCYNSLQGYATEFATWNTHAAFVSNWSGEERKVKRRLKEWQKHTYLWQSQLALVGSEHWLLPRSQLTLF